MHVARRLFLALFSASLATGCANTYEVQPAGEGVSVRLPADASILVGQSRDGRYGELEYAGSGRMATAQLVTALSKHSRNVAFSNQTTTLEEIISDARSRGAQFAIQPEILNWEDRATEWTGLPDRITLRLSVSDVATGKNLGTTVVMGKSGLATFGGDHPQDLLRVPFEEFAAGLF